MIFASLFRFVLSSFPICFAAAVTFCFIHEKAHYPDIGGLNEGNASTVHVAHYSIHRELHEPVFILIT